MTIVPSILITDDDSGFRETLKLLLEPEGYETFEATCGLEALDIVAHRPIDLMLLDMHMPRLTGLETVRKLRRLQFDVPCVLISARAEEVPEEESRAVQVYQVLPKPISRNRLREVVSGALRSRLSS